jgi:hypothetical protein
LFAQQPQAASRDSLQPKEQKGSPGKAGLGCSHGPGGKCVKCLDYKFEEKEQDYLIDFRDYLA